MGTSFEPQAKVNFVKLLPNPVGMGELKGVRADITKQLDLADINWFLFREWNTQAMNQSEPSF